jgi:hypothetical protein
MSYYNLCGIGSQHCTVIFQKEKGGWGYIYKSLVCKTPIVKVDRNKNVTLKKPRTNQFRQLFNYLLNLGRATSEALRNNVSINCNIFSQKSPHFSLLSPTSPCELSEREVTSPSNLKVMGALGPHSKNLHT